MKPVVSARNVSLVIIVAAWAATIGWPAIAAFAVAAVSFEDMNRAAGVVHVKPVAQTLATTVGWGVTVALCAALIGWLPGIALGRAIGSRNRIALLLATLLVVPLCLPSYLVFFAWWQSWPPETAIYRWVVENSLMQFGREITLLLSLVCWSWPLVSLCVAGSVMSWPRELDDLMRLDGTRTRNRLSMAFRRDRAALALGGLLVFLATSNNTTSFDLAEVFTFANELRAMDAFGAGPAQALSAGLPAMVIGAAGAAAVWWLVSRRTRLAVPIQGSQIHKAIATISLMIWCFAVVLPFGLFTSNILLQPETSVSEFWSFYRGGVMVTVGLAAISGAFAALLMVAFTTLWHDQSRSIRTLADLLALTWLFAALVPGTIVSVALEAAYNREALVNLVYGNFAILVIGHLSVFGFVAALIGRWTASSEPQRLADMRVLDDARSLRSFLIAIRPRVAPAAVAAAAMVFALALGEITLTARLTPPHRPGLGPLAVSILNDMHYQRPQMVMFAALGFLCGATIAAGLFAWTWRALRLSNQIAVVSAVAFASIFMLTGCGAGSHDNPEPLRTTHTFGSPGQSLGQFGYPRAIAVDRNHNYAFVIDKSARVQRFSLDGSPQLEWHMPQKENGKPTGVSVREEDGVVFIADTHYFRVIAYDSQGNELFRFGEYGRGPGQFMYVTDIAFGPNGTLYVSEYGGNDRVQVFSPPDENGTCQYLFEFGKFGSGQDHFNRPQALAFNADKSELYIADACNHRIVVTDSQGSWLRTIGSPGRELGQLMYPYSVEVLTSGNLLVCEFGNNRIHRFTASGKPLGKFGKVGRGTGELQYPWAVAAAENEIFVLDSGNNRVQVIGNL